MIPWKDIFCFEMMTAFPQRLPETLNDIIFNYILGANLKTFVF
jgi:hypothetical protein